MSKEHAYAYETGYRDGSVHYELEHCPACKNVADLQEALKENAKLREYVTELETANLDVTARLADYIGQYDPTDAFVAEIKAENAKLLDQKADAYNDMVNAQLDADALQAENAVLRELVRDMAAEIRGLGIDFARVGWCDYADRMRELGVEIQE